MLPVEEFNRKHTLPLVMVLMIGMIMGWLGFVLFGDFAGNTSIVYVSAKEVIKAEKDRIGDLGKETGRNHMFYGYSDEALKLVRKLAANLRSKRTKVIYVTDKAIKGESVTSASRHVHNKALELIEKKLNSVNLRGKE